MGTEKIITVLIDKIKVILWPVFILSATLTFMPKKWLEYLALLEIVNKYRAWISGSLLISISFVVVELFKIVKSKTSEIKKNHELDKIIKENLSNLSYTQNYIVHYLFAENTPSGMYLNVTHPEVNDLAHKGIIYRTSSIGQLNSFAYSLTPRAKKILNKNPEILEKIAEGYNENNIDKSVFGRTYF